MSLREFRNYLGDFAWFGPGVLLTLALGLLVGHRVGRAVGAGRLVGTLLVVGLGLVISATLTPAREALQFGAVGTGTCDLSRVGPASLGELLAFRDPTFNILLFIPLGLAIGLVPILQTRAILAIGAFTLPFVVETIQLLVTSLDRGCQSADVADNVTGLVVGLVLGVLVGRLQPPGRDASV